MLMAWAIVVVNEPLVPNGVSQQSVWLTIESRRSPAAASEILVCHISVCGVDHRTIGLIFPSRRSPKCRSRDSSALLVSTCFRARIIRAVSVEGM